MREYEREGYTLKSYVHERFRLDVYDENTNSEMSIYGDKIDELYFQARELAEEGKQCSIWELHYEFEP